MAVIFDGDAHELPVPAQIPHSSVSLVEQRPEKPILSMLASKQPQPTSSEPSPPHTPQASSTKVEPQVLSQPDGPASKQPQPPSSAYASRPDSPPEQTPQSSMNAPPANVP